MLEFPNNLSGVIKKCSTRGYLSVGFILSLPYPGTYTKYGIVDVTFNPFDKVNSASIEYCIATYTPT